MLARSIIALISAISASRSADPFTQPVRGFAEVDDWLDEHVESEDPAENLHILFQNFQGKSKNLLNASILRAVQLLQNLNETTTNNSKLCTSQDLELIRFIQRGTQAYLPDAEFRINKVVRPYALALVSKCEHQHELEFARLKIQFKLQLEPLEHVLDEKFITKHREKFHLVPIHFRQDHYLPYKCCLAEDSELEQLIRMRSIKLNPNECELEHLAGLIKINYERMLETPCRAYTQVLADTMERANSAAYFDPGRDFDFIAKRSRAFQLAVFRYQFCLDVERDREYHIKQLAQSYKAVLDTKDCLTATSRLHAPMPVKLH